MSFSWEAGQPADDEVDLYSIDETRVIVMDDDTVLSEKTADVPATSPMSSALFYNFATLCRKQSW
jgi:hypothetical protein